MSVSAPYGSTNQNTKQAWRLDGEKDTGVVAVQGLRLRVKGWRTDEPPPATGNKSAVMGFSASSQRSLVGRILSVTESLLMVGTGFLTLTFSDWAMPPDAVVAKRVLDTFLKRFRRAFPAGWIVWKQEIARRKSGDLRGMLFPHYHALVGGHGLSETAFLKWSIRNWLEVVGDDQEQSRRHGVKYRATFGGYRGVTRYLTKYLGKRVEREVAEEYGWMGRCWGIIGRENFPADGTRAAEIGLREMVYLRRLARGWLKSRGWSGRRYARRIARQPQNNGYELWGLPAAEGARMVQHAWELSRGQVSLVAQRVERWSIIDDGEIELQDVQVQYIEAPELSERR